MPRQVAGPARVTGDTARGKQSATLGAPEAFYAIPRSGLTQPHEGSMAAKKKSSARPAASKAKKKKPATRPKSASRKSASRKAAKRKPAAKPSATRRRRVATAVKATARRGLDVAKEGLGRIKSATSHLVEEVRDRFTGDEAEGHADGR
jgi:hypothetical protein